MSGTIGYDELRAATVRQVAQLMAAAAITAPKSGGQLFLAGKPNEFLHHTKTLRSQSAELEFTGPVCNLRDIDLGIAVGSAAKTAAIHSIDCRC